MIVVRLSVFTLHLLKNDLFNLIPCDIFNIISDWIKWMAGSVSHHSVNLSRSASNVGVAFSSAQYLHTHLSAYYSCTPLYLPTVILACLVYSLIWHPNNHIYCDTITKRDQLVFRASENDYLIRYLSRVQVYPKDNKVLLQSWTWMSYNHSDITITMHLWKYWQHTFTRVLDWECVLLLGGLGGGGNWLTLSQFALP